MNQTKTCIMRSLASVSIGRGIQKTWKEQNVAPFPARGTTAALVGNSAAMLSIRSRAMSGSNGYSEPDKQEPDGGFELEARSWSKQGRDALGSFVESYQRLLREHPVATKAVTSLIGFAIGDRIAQTIGGGTYAERGTGDTGCATLVVRHWLCDNGTHPDVSDVRTKRAQVGALTSCGLCGCPPTVS